MANQKQNVWVATLSYNIVCVGFVHYIIISFKYCKIVVEGRQENNEV